MHFAWEVFQIRCWLFVPNSNPRLKYTLLRKRKVVPFLVVEKRTHISSYIILWELRFNTRKNWTNKKYCGFWDGQATKTCWFYLAVIYQFQTLELFRILTQKFLSRINSQKVLGGKMLFKSRNVQVSVGNILLQSLLGKDKYSVCIRAWNCLYWETGVEVIFFWDSWWPVWCSVWFLI